jgi:hypothetical protein
MLQALRLQTEGQGRKQEIYSNDKCEVTRGEVLSTKVRAYTSRHVLKTIRASRRRQVLVVRRGRQSRQTHLFRHWNRWKDQQKVLWKAVGEDHGLESGQMPTCAGL